jgi:hypothetical protein
VDGRFDERGLIRDSRVDHREDRRVRLDGHLRRQLGLCGIYKDFSDSKMDDGGVYVVTLREAGVQRSELTIPRPNRKDSLTTAGKEYRRQTRPGERKARGKERERQEAEKKRAREEKDRCSTTVTVWKIVERQTRGDHIKMRALNTMELNVSS